MPSNNDDTPHIPSFATPLTPYLKSRRETLRIRQALTLYLKSLLTYEDLNGDVSKRTGCQGSHLDLCLPSDCIIGVKQIPPEIKGIRRNYLEALRRNLAAKQEYSLLVEKIQKNTPQITPESARVTSIPTLDDYVRLLRARRQYERLQVYSHHLDEIVKDTIHASDGDHLPLNDASRRWQSRLADLRGLESARADSERSPQVENLVLKLEQAVIQAHKQLDREKRLLRELKAMSESSPGSPGNPGLSPAVRLAALRRVRDGLVQWVEEKLSASSSGKPVPGSYDQGAIGEYSQQAGELKRQIKDRYAGYVRARAALVGAISAGVTIAGPLPVDVERTSTVPPKTFDKPGSTFNHGSIVSLAYAEGVLLPLAKSHQSLTLEKTYLAQLLDKEKQFAHDMFARLRDESHLLPEYPVLSGQERFKHVARKKSTSRAQPMDESGGDPIMRHARAWEFAFTAARSQELEHVEQKTMTGNEFVDRAYETVRELYDTLNEHFDEDQLADHFDGSQDGDESDIWTMESKAAQPRCRTYSKGTHAGPWAKVNGKIGLTERGNPEGNS